MQLNHYTSGRAFLIRVSSLPQPPPRMRSIFAAISSHGASAGAAGASGDGHARSSAAVEVEADRSDTLPTWARYAGEQVR